MSPTSWKPPFVLFCCVCFLFSGLLYWTSSTFTLDLWTAPHRFLRPSETKHVTPSAWVFDPTRDGSNKRLTYSQCSLAFPSFYEEVDRSYLRFRSRYVSAVDLNAEGNAHSNITKLLVYDGQLYVLHAGNLSRKGRSSEAIASLHRAVSSSSELQGLQPSEIWITFDRPMSSKQVVWSFWRPAHDEESKVWLMPDVQFSQSSEQDEYISTNDEEEVGLDSEDIRRIKATTGGGLRHEWDPHAVVSVSTILKDRLHDSGESAKFTTHYQTPAAEACYWRRLLIAWSKVSYTANTFEAGGAGKPLGVRFEDFLSRAT